MADYFYLTSFGKAFIPKRMRPHLHQFFEKTGRDEVPYHLFGVVFWIAVVLAYVVYIGQIYPVLKGLGSIVFFLITFFAFSGLLLVLIFIIGGSGYFYLNVRVYKRTKEMEDMLPDYLTLVSTSLKGGYSFENALWGAIKPEFGVLAKEIGLVSKKVMTGNEITDALNEFSEKYDSPLLKRSMALIVGEVESGGKIADVIDRVIENLKKTKALKNEMSANTLTYMIFISILVMFVMPALFALSFVLFGIITGFMGKLAGQVSNTSMSTFKLSKPAIKQEDFKIFSAMAITIIAIGSAIIVSIIEKGDVRAGVKYFPLFIVTSLFIYFVTVRFLSGIFFKLILGG